MSENQTPRRAGRPRAEDSPVALEDMLDAAFKAFARYGYDGMSVRTLNRELGVSHNLIYQRFGSKENLWRAAVDHSMSRLLLTLTTAFDPTLSDPLDQLNHAIRRFLEFSAKHPELLALMNIEAGLDTERLDYIYKNYVAPAFAQLERLLDHLADEGRIRPISVRTLNFLVAHGAAAPFTLVPLAQRFGGPHPLEPEEVERHAALAADILTDGLRVPATKPAPARRRPRSS
ncbi:TetR/AcrR family transcriptional regulator [Nocardioides sp. NPDC127514]|uniref:TetR/AcrR family transcriptional regulator n=1 Tax=unclassified Nocardioides TaxID=2615069 RepID=UPI00332105D1